MQKKIFLFIVIFIIAVFIGVGYFFSNISKTYSGPPALVVSEEIGDLGQIRPDEKQTYVFNLKNEGGEKLIIERVQAPCGCTATLLSEEEILPGKTTQLEVTFNPRGYEGIVTQSVYIYSNDPEMQRKRIGIRADVEHISAPKIQVSNNQWNLGLLSRGDSPELSLQIVNNGDLNAEIKGIDVPEYIKYEPEDMELPKTLEPEEELNMKFIYDSTEHEIGLVREYIRFITSDPSRKNITVRIEGYIKEEDNFVSISHFDSTLVIDEGETEFYKARFIIRNNCKESIQLVSIGSSVDYLEPVNKETILLAPGEEHEIIIKIDKKNIVDLYIGEKIEEYIYFNLALPVSISPDI